MDFHHQMTILQQSIAKNQALKLISPQKWRKLMLRCLKELKNKENFNNNLIDDLQTIVQHIPEEMFVESVLNLQPFRPKFEIKTIKFQHEDNHLSLKNIKELNNQSLKNKKYTLPEKNNPIPALLKFKQSLTQKLTDSIADMADISHGVNFLDQALSILSDEKTLSKQFEAKHHPYRKIIEQFLFIIQNKYKNYVGNSIVEVEQVQRMLLCDLNCLQEFIIKSSQPYLQIFRTENLEEKQVFIVRMAGFIKQYIEKHQKINQSIRKIMRLTSRTCQLIRHLQLKLPNFIEISHFQIPNAFTIEGCYIQSMGALIQFAQSSTPEQALSTLKNVRKLISADIDDYYNHHPEMPKKSQQLQISTQCQVQILKFMLCKLKSFLPEIYGQLMYLQVVLGQDDMSIRYDDSSYMYAQLLFACKSLEVDYP